MKRSGDLGTSICWFNLYGGKWYVHLCICLGSILCVCVFVFFISFCAFCSVLT